MTMYQSHYQSTFPEKRFHLQTLRRFSTKGKQKGNNMILFVSINDLCQCFIYLFLPHLASFVLESFVFNLPQDANVGKFCPMTNPKVLINGRRLFDQSAINCSDLVQYNIKAVQVQCGIVNMSNVREQHRTTGFNSVE